MERYQDYAEASSRLRCPRSQIRCLCNLVRLIGLYAMQNDRSENYLPNRQVQASVFYYYDTIIAVNVCG